MTANSEPVRSFVVGVWRPCLERVLQQISDGPVEVTSADPPEQAGERQSDLGAWSCFAADKGLRGEQALAMSIPDGVRLAQLFMGEPPNPDAELHEDYRDALSELFRQVQGAAAVELKAKLGKEVALVFRGQQAPAWTAAERFEFHVRLEGGNPVVVRLLVDDVLASALGNEVEAPAQPSGGVVSAPLPPRADNLDLFLDIELEGTLRFGERELALRDVLELHSGSVVELDHRVNDPVELLVGGRVIAKGEVVVMDGNYALRVTEVPSPSERMASLATNAKVP